MTPLSAFLLRRWRWLAAAAATVAVYAGLGFLVAPGLVRGQIVRRLGEVLRREVSVERVRLNPFALSATVEGFRVKDRDGAPLASFDTLYVNVDLVHLLRKEIGLAAVDLERPFLRVALDGRGRLNFQDLLEAGEAPAAAEAAPPRAGGFGLRVAHLRIAGAQVLFSDRARPRPFETTAGPVTLELRDFATARRDNQSPYSFSGQTESGERFAWSGTVLLDPIRSRGTFSLEEVLLPKYAPYFQDRVGFQLRSGTAALQATYELEWGARRTVRVVDASLGVRRLEVGREGADGPVVSLPEIDVSGAHADVLEREADVGRVALRGGRVEVRRGREGRLELLEMLQPPGATATSPASPPGPAEAPRPPAAAPPDPRPPAAAGPPGRGAAGGPGGVRFRLGELLVEGLLVAAIDEAAPRPVETELLVQRLAVSGASSAPDDPVRLALAALVDREGKVSVGGTIFPLRSRGEVDLELERLDVAPLDPYLDAALDARLEEAVLGVRGRLAFDAGGSQPTWAFRGDVGLDALRAVDGQRGEEFLRWRTLRLEGIEASPGRTALRAVRLVEPRLRAAIWEDGRRNLDVVARRPPPGAGGEGEAKAAAEEAARPGREGAGAPRSDGPRPRWSVGTLQLSRGRASLVDRSVRPPVVLEVSDVEVRVRGLASDPRARAQVEARARVGTAPLSVTGTLQPLLLGASTELAVRSQAIDLTPLGPYVGKHLGYELQKGKLDLDLRYTVRERAVEGENLARVDQFTLGEATGSPDATSLPVKLGLAVLTDREGVIRLDVPVTGSVDDPDFSVRRMVWRALGNLFTKVALSPFAALGSLFGGGEESLDVLEFAAGGAALDEPAERKLQVLEKALSERPALRLDVEGVADEGVDGPALRRAAMQDEVRRAKWSALRRKDPGLALESVTVGADEYPRWLEAALKARPSPPPSSSGAASASPAPPPAGKGPPGPAEMEERLLASLTVSPEAYRELAAARGEAARARLIREGKVDPARVYLAEGGERARKERGARAYFTLR